MKIIATLSALALVPFATFAGGNLTEGDATMAMIGTPIWSSPTGGDSNLFPNGGTSGDQLFKYAWYYRQQANNQNRIMSSLDTPTEVYSGNTATITYTNAGPGPVGQGRFNATFELTLIDGAGLDQARLESRLTFTAATSNTQPLVCQVFNLVDFDLTPSALDDSAVVTDTSEVRSRLTDPTGTFAEHLGVGALRYEVGSSSSLRTKVSSGSNDLSNIAAFGPGDAASAMQWQLILQPGESAVIYSGISLNVAATPEPASLALLALAGLLGFRRR